MSEEFIFDEANGRDFLTDVFTRETVVEYVNYLIGKDIPFSFAIVDIDNFKYVNDTYGHISGDDVLKQVALHLKKIIGDSGIVGRFGGDEFILVFKNLVEYDDVWNKFHDLMVSMQRHEIKGFNGLFITLTAGISRFPENEKSYGKLFDIADKALYRGKTKGRNCFIIYLPEKHGSIQLKTKKETTLSSMYLHASVFKILTKTEDYGQAIENLFNFLSSYFMVDHICIQKGNAILHEKIYNLASNKEFRPFTISELKENLNPAMEIFYFNQVDTLSASGRELLCEEYKAQHIYAGFVCLISDNCAGETAVLRVESTGKRVWQYGEMDIYMTAAKVIGILVDNKKLAL